MKIYNGKVVTMTDIIIEKGYVEIKSGKIAKIGEMDSDFTADKSDYDALGGWIVPGIIDAYTFIGLREVGGGDLGNDSNELSSPFTPEMSAADGIYPKDKAFGYALKAGVTAAVTSPGNMNVIGGQAVVIKFRGRTASEMVLKSPSAIKISLGDEPKAAWADRGKGPQTRVAALAMLREMLDKACEYKSQIKEGKCEKNPKLHALLPLIKGEIPAFIHAQRTDDILSAIEISKEYNFKCVIVHGAESGMVAEYIKKDETPVILGPMLLVNSKYENRNATPATAAVLSDKGVKFAISSDHFNTPIQYLPVSAAVCVRYGLDETKALKAITIYAAEIAGVSDRIGSLETGKDADIVVFNHNPLSYKATAQIVFIDGEIVYLKK